MIEISCTLEDWMQHGPKVAACVPLGSVKFTDCEPASNGCMHLWYPSNPPDVLRLPHDDLPDSIYCWLQGGVPNGGKAIYRSYFCADDAIGALSDAAIAWAKQQAELTPEGAAE